MLKSNPVKVRFAEEVIINGQVPVSSTAHTHTHNKHTHAHTIMYDLYKQCQMVATYIIKTESSVNARQIRHFMNSFFRISNLICSLGNWKTLITWPPFAEPGEGQLSPVHAKCPEGLPGERADKVFSLRLRHLYQGVCPLYCVCSTPLPPLTPPGRHAQTELAVSAASIITKAEIHLECKWVCLGARTHRPWNSFFEFRLFEQLIYSGDVANFFSLSDLWIQI